jgi:WD40 repeat protein
MRSYPFALLLLLVLGCARPTIKEMAVLRGHTKSVSSLAFSPDGKTVASGSSDETIRIWDFETGKELSCYKEQDGKVIAVAFTPDGKSLGRNRSSAQTAMANWGPSTRWRCGYNRRVSWRIRKAWYSSQSPFT